jgi:hypothetical protein
LEGLEIDGDTLKIDSKEIRCEGMDIIFLVEDMDKMSSLVITIISLLVRIMSCLCRVSDNYFLVV